MKVVGVVRLELTASSSQNRLRNTPWKFNYTMTFENPQPFLR